ncbi:MAG: HlyD family efflux transporter periplasmic adaptor subunit [Pseudomonadota bacterium]
MNFFPQTEEQLRSNRDGTTTWVLIGAVLLIAAWLAWAMIARVSLYAVSSEARVELQSATYPIASPFLGRVVSADLRVGRSVRRGEVLVEIDSMPQQLQLQEAQAEQHGLAPQLAQLQAQISAQRGALTQERATTVLASEEAARRAEEARIAAETAETEATRMRTLQKQGLVAARDLEKAESELRMRHEAAAALQAAGRRVPQEQRTKDDTRMAQMAELQGQLANLASRDATLHAEIERLQYEIERRHIRAPVDGRIGEAATVHVGTVVDEAEKLGSIVPAGDLIVVAQYPAQDAFGRLRPGQHGVLRLQGFPWAEFGVVGATVHAVAQEIRDGKVRVELTLEPSPNFHGRLDHGMPGSIEVTVERLSPLALLLRTSGQWFTAQT